MGNHMMIIAVPHEWFFPIFANNFSNGSQSIDIRDNPCNGDNGPLLAVQFPGIGHQPPKQKVRNRTHNHILLKLIPFFKKGRENTKYPGWVEVFYFSIGNEVEKNPKIVYNNYVMTNLDSKPDVSLASLETLFWDYNYSLTGKDLYDFVLGEKEIPFLDRNQVKARMLMTVCWYRLIDIFGLSNLRLLLTDDALKWVWVDELREQYALARQTIERALS
jgi:hypothetical protein